MRPKPGNGPTVLLTRSDTDNAACAPLFHAAGLSTVSVPGINIVPPDDWDPTDETIAHLDGYDGIVFTSRHAVEAFLRRLDEIRTDGRSVLKAMTVAAIGKRTEETLRAEGIAADIIPDVGSAGNLVASLSTLDVTGKHLLFPKSSIARDEVPVQLRDRGALVDEVVVYQTIPPDAQAVSAAQTHLLDGTIGYAAFFSPSAVRNILELFVAGCFERTTIAVIGPTTAAAVSAAGLHPSIIAPTPQAEDLVAAIADHAASEKTTSSTSDKT